MGKTYKKIVLLVIFYIFYICHCSIYVCPTLNKSCIPPHMNSGSWFSLYYMDFCQRMLTNLFFNSPRKQLIQKLK